jgi:hypothetical protein
MHQPLPPIASGRPFYFTMTFRFWFQVCFTVAMTLLAGCTSDRTKKEEGKILVPDGTLSPDGRYGVTVPVFDFDTEAENAVIEVRTHRVLAVIHGPIGYDRSVGHRSEPVANWSHDGSLLLWTVRGKWSPCALTLLKVENHQVLWQKDLLLPAQQAILTRTREADPKKYAAAQQANKGNGSAFPEGFTVDVEVLEPISVPLHLRAFLTSNPKGIEWMPTLASNLDALIDEEGKLLVTNFKLGHASWHSSY